MTENKQVRLVDVFVDELDLGNVLANFRKDNGKAIRNVFDEPNQAPELSSWPRFPPLREVIPGNAGRRGATSARAPP